MTATNIDISGQVCGCQKQGKLDQLRGPPLPEPGKGALAVPRGLLIKGESL